MLQNKMVQVLDGFQEGLTGYVGVISSDHAYVHASLAYTAFISTGSISAPYDIAFTTPTVASGKEVHWRPVGITTSANYVEFTLREGDSFSGGTAVTPINRNRESVQTSKMQSFVKGATATPTGTIVSLSGVGSTGAPQARSGGGAGADQELMLKQNTNYVLTLDPAGATECTLELFWYEENE